MILGHLGDFVLVCVILAPIFHEEVRTAAACPKHCRCLIFEGRNSVYCNRTAIAAIPGNISTNTQLLDVSWNNIVSVSDEDLVGLTNLEVINLAANNFVETSISDRALDLPVLVAVDLSYNLFTVIPRFLPSVIINLTLFTNQLTELRADNLVRYTSLQNLDISNNDISIIHADTFSHTKDLLNLDLSYNKLTDESFPATLFFKTPRLRTLSLRFNQLDHLLQDLPETLQHLDYVGNRIKTLPALSFQSLSNLKSLRFWKCQILTIENQAFRGLSRLTFLDLMENKINSTITDSTLEDLVSVETLYLGMNNINQVQPNAFHSLRSVKTIWLTGNELRTLDPEVLNTTLIPQLSVLYLDFNPWYCDCHLRWLRESMDNATYVIHEADLVQCAGPPKVAGKSFRDLNPNDFVCN